MEVVGQFGGGGEGRSLEKVTFDWKFEGWEGAKCVGSRQREERVQRP